MKIAAVVATCDRPRLLFRRAIKSIAEQERKPNILVVVDDSRSSRARQVNRELLGGMFIPNCEIFYIENGRSKGASGSWNCAFDFIRGNWRDEDFFIAILDDDDAWHQGYLRCCEREAESNGLDMIAAGIRRIGAGNEVKSVEAAPESLNADDFLVGNPGIQGSNLFVRLDVLLRAGGFDENLASTTDRDLCIRIADMASCRYGKIDDALVDHFVEKGRRRLSSRGNGMKISGLDSFWRKYSGRMKAEQKAGFIDRATRLFGWFPPDSPLDGHEGAASSMQSIILGIDAGDFSCTDLDERLMMLSRLCSHSEMAGICIVFMGSTDHNESLADAADLLLDAGAVFFRVPRQDILHCEVGSMSLEQYCEVLRASRPGARIWRLTSFHQDDGFSGDGGLIGSLIAIGAKPIESVGEVDRQSSIKISAWIVQERVRQAEIRLRRKMQLSGVLCILGWGSESVVFSDGNKVFKCIDYWKSRQPRESLDFLASKSGGGAWSGVKGVYPLEQVVEYGPFAIITYKYQKSDPYRGGYEEDIIGFLHGCKAAGIVCNNVHPKNMVVSDSGVMLIDYGSDIKPWSELGFEHMMRRAYLSCWHAADPDLDGLMKKCLSDIAIPELSGYPAFREKVENFIDDKFFGSEAGRGGVSLRSCSFNLYVGVISSEPRLLRYLLSDFVALKNRAGFIGRLTVVALDNGCDHDALHLLAEGFKGSGIDLFIIDKQRQIEDVGRGGFGKGFSICTQGKNSIAKARTMIQRYVGELGARDSGAFAWIIDDDMRVDERALRYLEWLPALRKEGVDVLIGAYEGASPNPPMNGLRLQMLDVISNFKWLSNLDEKFLLPDRSAENSVTRNLFPDYYYDLSRKHTAHLETPCWIEPEWKGERVGEAKRRLVYHSRNILYGRPLVRRVVPVESFDPVSDARDSLNRGGCTFILNPEALLAVPNLSLSYSGVDARRSDMIWAVINKCMNGMVIREVGFPVVHGWRAVGNNFLGVEKEVAELLGASIYSVLCRFISCSDSDLFPVSMERAEAIACAFRHDVELRMERLFQSLKRISGLRDCIEADFDSRKALVELMDELRGADLDGFFHEVRIGVDSCGREDVVDFILSLPDIVNDYRCSRVDVSFLM